jgi:hypothetical protein
MRTIIEEWMREDKRWRIVEGGGRFTIESYLSSVMKPQNSGWYPTGAPQVNLASAQAIAGLVR